MTARFQAPLLAVTIGCVAMGCAENKYFVSASMFESGLSDSPGGAANGSVDPGMPDGAGDTGWDTGDFDDDTGAEGIDDGTDWEGEHSLQNWDHITYASDIWTGLAADNGEVQLVTLEGSRVVLYDLTAALQPIGDPKLLLPNQPFPGFDNTDIAVARIADWIYVVVSNPAATELVMAAYASDGTQVLSPQRVVERSPVPTNDMKLVVRDGSLHLFYGGDGYEKQVMVFDRDLASLPSPGTIDDPTGGSQMGCVVPTDDGFVRIEGNRDNHGLVRIEYGPDWSVEASDWAAMDVPASDAEWIWFPTGCVQDPLTGDWFVAHQHMWDGDFADEDSSVRVARFGADWTYRESIRVSEPQGFTRPQLVLEGDRLILTYDMRFDVRGAISRLSPDR